MDEDRIAGTARTIGGKVQEEVGRFTGDTQTQIKGMASQAPAWYRSRMAEVTCWDMPLLEEIVAAKQRIREENPLWVWAHETYWDRFAG